jgi:hypothetical protein
MTPLMKEGLEEYLQYYAISLSQESLKIKDIN